MFGEVKNYEVLIMQFPPVPYHLVAPRVKHLP